MGASWCQGSWEGQDWTLIGGVDFGLKAKPNKKPCGPGRLGSVKTPQSHQVLVNGLDCPTTCEVFGGGENLGRPVCAFECV